MRTLTCVYTSPTQRCIPTPWMLAVPFLSGGRAGERSSGTSSIKKTLPLELVGIMSQARQQAHLGRNGRLPHLLSIRYYCLRLRCRATCWFCAWEMLRQTRQPSLGRTYSSITEGKTTFSRAIFINTMYLYVSLEKKAPIKQSNRDFRSAAGECVHGRDASV